MSKLKIGDNVIVKETGNVGVVKGREIIPTEGLKNRIEYVVRTGNGFENWKAYSKNELEKLPVKEPSKKVYPKLVIETEGGYKVTVVALIDSKENIDYIYEDEDFLPICSRTYRLRIGYSIYNPCDDYDEAIGERIALHRAKTDWFSCIHTRSKAEFTKETVSALLYTKGRYIADNIKKFVETETMAE